MTPLAGRRFLVTGGAGFLGSHLVEALRRSARPAEIVVARSREHDLTDRAAARRLIAGARPDVIFHLAARVGGIGANRRLPGSFLHDNLAMGLHVLDEARRAGVARLVLVGTVCAYPHRTPIPFCEDDLWNGYPEPTNAPYGVAKRALLVMAQAYRREFGCDFVTVLPANLYGPGDHFDLEDGHVIPAMIRKLDSAAAAGAGEVVLGGDGTPTRDFLYVEDCAAGLLLAAERQQGGEPVNLGSGREIAMRDLAAIIAGMVGYRGAIGWDASRPNGQPRRLLDTRRARALGFEATTSLEDGLARTIAWYRAAGPR